LREASQSTPTYKGLVVGCGLAGSTREEGNHVECYQLHPQCELMGVLDKFTEPAQKAAQSHDCYIYPDLDSALSEEPNIVSLAIHPEWRGEYLEKICQISSVRAIFCEKPLGYSATEAWEVVQLCQNKQKLLYVNFQRRGNLTYQQLSQEFQKQTRGKLQNAIFYYTRGMWSNASHYIDLCLMFFGKPEWVWAQESPIPSPYPNDANATIILGYPEFHVHLIPLLTPMDSFYSGDHEFIFEKEKLSIPNLSFYEDDDVRRWVSQKNLLTPIVPDITLHRDHNDYLPILDRIIFDLDRHVSESSLDPMDAVWTVKILELALRSRQEHCRLDIPKIISE